MADVVRDGPLPAFQFHVRLDDLEFGFSKVSGLSREIEPVLYQEGGLNDRVHVLPGPVKSCGTVRLERGVYQGERVPFYLVGVKLNVPMRIEVWKQDSPKNGGKVFTLTGLVVKRWEVSDLDALQNSLLIDRFDLGFEHLRLSTS